MVVDRDEFNLLLGWALSLSRARFDGQSIVWENQDVEGDTRPLVLSLQSRNVVAVQVLTLAANFSQAVTFHRQDHAIIGSQEKPPGEGFASELLLALARHWLLKFNRARMSMRLQCSAAIQCRAYSSSWALKRTSWICGSRVMFIS